MNRIIENDLNFILNQTQNIINKDFLKGSNIFITGATGFFGKWLLESFLFLNRELNLKISICALSRNPEKFLDQFPLFKNENCLIWIKGDVKTFKFPLEQYQYIIHAATDSDAILYEEYPLLMIDTITGGTRRVLDFATKQSNLKAFLFTSSGAIYGKQPENITKIKETDSYFIDINSPSSAYAEGKRMSELYCTIYAKQYNIPVKIARCFAFCGPYLPIDKHFAIGNFINDSLKGGPILVNSDGTSHRSYLYAADLVVWLLTILLKGEKCRPYNVGSENEISIEQLALMVRDCFTSKIELKIQQRIAEGKISEKYIPSTERARNELNLSQTYDLKESIIRTIKYIENLN